MNTQPMKTNPNHVQTNLRRMRHTPNLAAKEKESLENLEAWINEWGKPWVSISGGKDSLVALDLVRRIDPSIKVAFFDSGLEFPQTQKYVKNLAKHWGLDLHVYQAEPDALTILAENGTWDHFGTYVAPEIDLHEAVVERPLQRALQELGPVCVYGVRADEAENRRMYLTRNRGKVVKRERSGELISSHFSPAWRWSSEEVFSYIVQRNLPLNPLYQQQIEQGVPELRARVGMMIDGWSLEQGRWKVAYAIAPEAARRVEMELPILRDWR